MNQQFEFETFITCVVYLVICLFSFAPDLLNKYHNPKTKKNQNQITAAVKCGSKSF